MSICKPESRDAPIYKSLRRFLRESLATVGEQTSATDVTGQWIGEVARKGLQAYRITFDLEVISGRLLGTVRYPTGDAGIRDGEVQGDRVRFRTTHTPQFAEEPAEIRFDGTIADGRMDLVLQDSNGHARVTARREGA